ncbi:MAG TPA: NUDIX hydrolase [Candidatus Saccharimonadales bacterium]|nr:NUDIX hydrolase [Candidatus Saccharimonadales bacterium]
MRSIVAKAILLDKANNILILRRSGTHPYWAFQLDLPGGSVEVDEEPLFATVREIYEESGLRVAPTELQLALAEDDEDDTHHHMLYWARLSHTTPRVQLSWEHDLAEWLPFSELATRTIAPNADSYFLRTMRYLHENHDQLVLR